MPPKKTQKGDAPAPKREDSLSRHYPKLQDGSSVFGLEEFDDEARAHVIGTSPRKMRQQKARGVPRNLRL